MTQVIPLPDLSYIKVLYVIWALLLKIPLSQHLCIQAHNDIITLFGA